MFDRPFNNEVSYSIIQHSHHSNPHPKIFIFYCDLNTQTENAMQQERGVSHTVYYSKHSERV